MKSIAHVLTLMLTAILFIMMPVTNPVSSLETPSEITSTSYVDIINTDITSANSIIYDYSLCTDDDITIAIMVSDAIISEKTDLRLSEAYQHGYNESIYQNLQALKQDHLMPPSLFTRYRYSFSHS
ncbi:MAG: hypothetical protein LAT57_00175 [Balneolales bacterium]|nr:hypothetical protein [Balneolales bacterium]